MGLQTELGYESRPATGVQRAMQRLASSRAGSWTFSRVLHPIDRLVFRRTNGRATVAGLVAGLPVVLLSTTGAKSGLTRTMPLLGVPVGDDIAVIGSNYGQHATPGWVYNLEADPRAVVEFRDRTCAIHARLADADEADEVFGLAAPIYGGFEKYRDRADHRQIKVFVLEPEA